MTRPLNYTTKIPAKRTAGECLDLLGDAGADHVSVSYEDRRPVGLIFSLHTAGGYRNFALPVDADATQKVLRKALGDDRPHVSTAEFSRMLGAEHALDVAWRVIRDWIEAQLALIATGMASLDQVMLPYLEVDPGQTLYQRYLETQQLAIEGATR